MFENVNLEIHLFEIAKNSLYKYLRSLPFANEMKEMNLAKIIIEKSLKGGKVLIVNQLGYDYSRLSYF